MALGKFEEGLGVVKRERGVSEQMREGIYEAQAKSESIHKMALRLRNLVRQGDFHSALQETDYIGADLAGVKLALRHVLEAKVAVRRI